jgi:hypothetical protein
MATAGLVAFQPWTRSESSSQLDRIQLFVLAIGLVLTAIGYSPVIRHRQLKARARGAIGRVVDHVHQAPVVEFDVGEAHVRFVGPDAPTDDMPLGSTVDVLYDPEEPAGAVLAGYRPRPSRWLMVGVALLATGVVFTWL